MFECALGSLALFLAVLPADAQRRMWIDSESNKRRTCPSIECGVVGRFFIGESVTVYRTVNGWSQVSGYYSAGCNDGRSAFVDSGRRDCTKENGIDKGEFAEWVRSDFLTAESPSDSQ
jgi:hypothetical protein